ncbi:exodeoxyribonuclease V subunit alpha [Cognatiluteimonas weifangensis]|uniref:RecBCD enzyme subunit RecD n=1 Tax=Cognatiluteimonas weifangensis TaxID=2303539 RepID=A0A372DPI5_9GAMM|nr:exodeoxyribonuclease V subunit alpha [Luteimonas weifangensis]RFP61461.1 exodeoxyribonuclease V subunit alpha [Luteimonas weifangensis]
MTATPLLDALWHAGALRTLDHALAQSLRRLDPDTPDAVLAAAALASLAVAQGHAGFDPASPQGLVDNPRDLPWPAADAWQRQLAASRWVATPGDAAETSDAGRPLVWEGAPGLLYLRRYREYERRLAAGLRRIGAHPPAAAGSDALAPLTARLFPQAADGEDRQAAAAALALRHALLLVTGGPGTGKTTTIARLLVLLAAQARQAGRAAPRIALAAPTGRAAERMAESVRNALQALPAQGIDATLVGALPTTGTTLHRLLGTIPDSPRFRHDADNPLPHDVVVVDEASMIDLPLMAKLVEAVPDGARLVLLGDPDQLPSVEAGDVLSGILRAAGADAFPGRRVHLQRGWRQHDALQLAPLAAAVRDGDSAAALALLRGGTLSSVHFHPGLADPLQGRGPQPHRERLLAHWRALAAADSPAQALALAAHLRLLTAVRDGPQGARTLNARIETLLAQSGSHGPRRGAGYGPAASPHFHGRLLLITENSYRHRLFNGDIGICFRDADGSVMAWFPGDTPDAPRAFHPAALPAHDSAFAMTVHKAQGSEFDEVWLLLPAHDSRVLSRELVYTAITRARRELHVAGSAEVIAAALGRHASRWSGLGWRLGESHVVLDGD